ncbi:hypothetical protein PH5382_03885 [Phaeobacter sp. CECT 5382]|uniref:hypothetical protein n=1 Tax=Phaeobacter sp. CECT 5382 TaxID=1712645 RepID=UPI0006DB8115|nr:hypothetical protein [Phaeobacter sp. CECT 5382]CUH89930.1 hypothetical protein PH5382_03885 [Phaeobacter sp. CECT 5382]
MKNCRDYDIYLSFDEAIRDRDIECLPSKGKTDLRVPNSASKNWQKLYDSQSRQLIDESVQFFFANSVRIFQLSEGTRKDIEEFKLWFFSQPKYHKDAIKERIEELGIIRKNFSGVDAENFHFLGVAHLSGGRNTTTRDSEKNIVGLHLDTFDKAPMQKRKTARNRVAINVGSESRYLMFVPYTAKALIEVAERQGGEWVKDAYDDHRVFVRKFFKYVCPDIFRIRIEPGEGYIAPTENMLHDGSTFDAEKDDITLVWLGYLSRLEGGT